jgi:hypothetical protein
MLSLDDALCPTNVENAVLLILLRALSAFQKLSRCAKVTYSPLCYSRHLGNNAQAKCLLSVVIVKSDPLSRTPLWRRTP